jgi:SSS family solute:Na+ symporter
MGIFVGSALLVPAGMDHAASQMGVARKTLSSTLATEPDRMLPIFVLSYLPHGLIGMIFVAILSALMSSMDSAINSLSAVTVRDIYQVYIKPNASDTHYLRISRFVTILWGLFCMTAALAMYALSKSTRETTIVLINAVGSLLYGPILATFLLGIKSRFADSRSVSLGIWLGIAVNAFIWIFTDVSWIWWNVIGFATVVAVSVLLSWRRISKNTVELDIVDPDTKLKQRSTHLLLGIYAILIVLFCFALQQRLAE